MVEEKPSDLVCLAGQRHSAESEHSTEVLSPVLRLNFDVLSIIFNVSWDRDVKSSKTLSSVCRHWRGVALSVPQLWTQLPPHYYGNEEYLIMILNRSHPLPLHVMLSSQTHPNQRRILATVTERFGCLKLLDELDIMENNFPILERLEFSLNTIVHWDRLNKKKTSLLDASRFPKLKEFHNPRQQLPLSRLIMPNSLPPLQVLSINSDGQTDWVSVVSQCADTLVSLYILVTCTEGLEAKFIFPRLQYISIVESRTDHPVHLHINAPYLLSIHESLDSRAWPSQLLLKLRYPQTVQNLYIERNAVNPAEYPGLRNLWIVADMVDVVVHLIKDVVQNCLLLESVQYHTGNWQAGNQIEKMIEDAVQASGRCISTSQMKSSTLELPGSIPRNVRLLR